MPRYFFDLADGRRDDDDEGTELEGLDCAMTEAVRLAGRQILDDPDLVKQTGRFSVTVSNEYGVFLGGVDVTARQTAHRKPLSSDSDN